MKGRDLSQLTVLIVEKQPPMRTLLREVLREFGVGGIHDAHNLEKGFEEFNNVTPDLVLTDWCPDFDGLDLVKRIRTDKQSCYPQVPITMITAFGETKRVHQARDAGANEYLVKPVSARLLNERLVSAIENTRPFIRSTNFTGPCRRRHMLPRTGNDRRQARAKPRNPRPAATPAEGPASTKAA